MNALRFVLGLVLSVASASAFSQAGTPSGCESLQSIPTSYRGGFEGIYADIIVQRCNGCHIGDDQGGFNMDVDFAYGNVLQPSSTGAGLFRVKPRDPLNSFLFRKINCSNPGLGERMPSLPINGIYLSVAEQARIYDWIASGAPFEQIFADGIGEARR